MAKVVNKLMAEFKRLQKLNRLQPNVGPRRLSHYERARHAAAARERWAKLKGEKPPDKVTSVRKGRPKIDEAMLARIRALARARWAKVYADKASAKEKHPRTKKPKAIAAIRARIKAAAKARWAKAKAAGINSLR